MPYEATTKAQESVMRIEDIERPERDDDTLYDAMYLDYLQLGEHQASEALQRQRRALKCAAGNAFLEAKYRNEIQETLIELRWMRDQLNRLRITTEQFTSR